MNHAETLTIQLCIFSVIWQSRWPFNLFWVAYLCHLMGASLVHVQYPLQRALVPARPIVITIQRLWHGELGAGVVSLAVVLRWAHARSHRGCLAQRWHGRQGKGDAG